MFGETRSGIAYYSCHSNLNGGKGAEKKFVEHLPPIYVREDALLEGLLTFFVTRIFGEDRQKLLEKELQKARSSNRTGHQNA
jgi:hypothetical protein